MENLDNINENIKLIKNKQFREKKTLDYVIARIDNIMSDVAIDINRYKKEFISSNKSRIYRIIKDLLSEAKVLYMEKIKDNKSEGNTKIIDYLNDLSENPYNLLLKESFNLTALDDNSIVRSIDKFIYLLRQGIKFKYDNEDNKDNKEQINGKKIIAECIIYYRDQMTNRIIKLLNSQVLNTKADGADGNDTSVEKNIEILSSKLDSLKDFISVGDCLTFLNKVRKLYEKIKDKNCEYKDIYTQMVNLFGINKDILQQLGLKDVKIFTIEELEKIYNKEGDFFPDVNK